MVVVGSGYGGSVAASRLSRAGRRVCVLELGKETVPGEYAKNVQEVLPELKLTLPDGSVWPQDNQSGFFDFMLFKNVIVWKGCGLGGGSLVNSSISIKPDPRVFDMFPAAIRDDPSSMEDGYARASAMLCPTVYPDMDTKPLQQAEVLKAASGGQGFTMLQTNTTFRERVNAQGITQPACTLCGDCNTGCNYGAKNTLLMNYLPDAYQHGAELFVTVAVKWVEPAAGGGWTVHAVYFGDGEARDLSVHADVVVLGAGCVGSTEIMLRSKAKGLAVSSLAGQRFGGDGDFFGIAYNGDKPAHGIGCGERPLVDMKGKEVGPCISCAWDLRDPAQPLDKGLVIENISVPGPFGHLLSDVFPAASLLFGRDHQQAAPQLARIAESVVGGPYVGATDHTVIFGGMAAFPPDDQSGYMQLTDDRVQICWPDPVNKPHNDYIISVMEQGAKRVGATLVVDPFSNPLKVEGPDARKMAVVVHPFGGCVTGDSAQTGVVNHKGQVFRTDGSSDTDVFEGLYVLDSSAMPSSIGVNPLWTISAFAERACTLMAADYGWHIDYKSRGRRTMSQWHW